MEPSGKVRVLPFASSIERGRDEIVMRIDLQGKSLPHKYLAFKPPPVQAIGR